jgi:hypothetical protein
MVSEEALQGEAEDWGNMCWVAKGIKLLEVVSKEKSCFRFN